MNNVILIANGAVSLSQRQQMEIDTATTLIAVDGGLKHCKTYHLTPHLIIGDLDSISPELLNDFSSVPIKQYLEDKDETDLELALKFVSSSHPKKIKVFGALGCRTDHMLANLQLLTLYPEQLIFENNHEQLFALGKETTIKTFVGQTVSLLPIFGPVLGVTTTGLKWELQDATLNEHFLSISNVSIKESISVILKRGHLLCCLNF